MSVCGVFGKCLGRFWEYLRVWEVFTEFLGSVCLGELGKCLGVFGICLWNYYFAVFR